MTIPSGEMFSSWTERLARAAYHTHNPIWLADREGRIEWVNEAFTRVTGYGLVALGEPDRWAFAGERGLPARIAAALARDDRFHEAVTCLDARGRSFVTQLECHAQRDPQGTFAGYVAVMSETIELLELKSECAKQAERYDLAMTAASMGIWEWDIQKGALDFDERQYVLFGIDPSADPEAHRNWRKRVLPEDLAAVDESLARALHGGDRYSAQFRIRRDDGQVRWLNATGIVLRDDQGRPARLVGANVDNTASRLLEEQRREIDLRMLELAANEREAVASLEEAQAMARLGSWSYSVATGKIDWSQQMYAIHGRDPALGPPDYATSVAYYAEEERERIDTLARRAIEQGTPYSAVMRLHDPKNGVAIVQTEGKVNLDSDGRAIRVFGTVMDITQALEREEALKRAQVQAEAASRTKGEFLANMSHELRTPMAAVLGYVDLLADPSLPYEQLREYTSIIQRNAKHLLELINQVLDLSKIEAGQMTVERLECSPAAIFREIISLMRPHAMDKRLRLSMRFEGPVPATIESDPTRLRQVVLNLVGNAIKFTEKGGVDLTISLDRARTEPQLVIAVQDSGIGIAPEKLGHLFRPFSQADSSTTRRFGGTGLGLSIADHLTRLLGGSIDVRSTPGQGTTFSARVATGSLDGVALSDHLNEVEDSALRPSQEQVHSMLNPLAGLHILLAEDGPDNQRLITLHLKRAGASVEVVGNGKLACERLLAGDAPEFDAVLMDMQMPVMDGYAATARLRSHGYAGAIVALTAHAMIGDRDKCLQAGCDGYATKPIDNNRLIATILTLARRHAASSPGAQQASLLPGRPILVSTYQDDPIMIDLIEHFTKTMPERAAAIESALGAEDLEGLARLAHQLAGAGGGYGFPTISEAAQQLEAAIRARANPSALQACVNKLSSICRSVRFVPKHGAAASLRPPTSR